MTKISVVIPTFNSDQVLAETLSNLAQQSIPYQDYEIIVVDDKSENDCFRIAQEFRETNPQVSTILKKHEFNRGTYAAYNTGAKLSNSQIILFLDQDCVPHYKLLEEHIKTHKQNDYAPIAVVGRFKWHSKMKLGKHLKHFRPQEDTLMTEPEDINNLQLAQFITGNCSVSSSAFQQIGGFDEKYIYGFGDTDLGLRWRRHGYRMVGNIDAIVFHYHPMTFADQLQRKRRIGTQYPAFCELHPDNLEDTEIVSVYEKTYVDNLLRSLLEYFFHLGNREELGLATKAELEFASLILSQNWDEIVE